MNQPSGTIRKTELRNILQALALARPDQAEALALVAIATGLGECLRLPNAQVGREEWRRVAAGEGSDEG